MIFMAQIEYKKLYTIKTKSTKQNVNNSQKDYVYKPYRTLNNY